MATVMWGADAAARYDAASTEMFEPAVLGPAVDVLAALAGGGPALEFAVGTGRVALPLSERGVPVAGIELSPHMAEMHRSKPGASAVPVTIGDMATTRVPGEFSLVYLVYNTIMNLTTQDEQVAVFANAAAHLRPGGRFVLEVEVPSVPRIRARRAGPDLRPLPRSRRDRHARRPGRPALVLASLDAARRAVGPGVRPVPLRVAVRARPDGAAGRAPVRGPLGRLGPLAVHRGEPQPGRRVREAVLATRGRVAAAAAAARGARRGRVCDDRHGSASSGGRSCRGGRWVRAGV